jgi:hypothetical protein
MIAWCFTDGVTEMLDATEMNSDQNDDDPSAPARAGGLRAISRLTADVRNFANGSPK